MCTTFLDHLSPFCACRACQHQHQQFKKSKPSRWWRASRWRWRWSRRWSSRSHWRHPVASQLRGHRVAVHFHWSLTMASAYAPLLVAIAFGRIRMEKKDICQASACAGKGRSTRAQGRTMHKQTLPLTLDPNPHPNTNTNQVLRDVQESHAFPVEQAK